MKKVLFVACSALFFAVNIICGAAENGVYDVSGKLELFYDDFLIANKQDLTFVQHSPRECTAAPGKPNGYYGAIFHDGTQYRYYYRNTDNVYSGKKYNGHPGEYLGVTFSKDGINWQEKDLKLFPGKPVPPGAVWYGNGFTHNLMPFFDRNPQCTPDKRFKAVSGVRETAGLFAFYSADGINWKHYDAKNPIFKYEPKKYGGHFIDSQNAVFYSEYEKCYVMYPRVWKTADGLQKVRSFGKTTSKDFRNWSKIEFLKVNEPGEHLYISGLHPYFRAPHYYIGAATRYFGNRGSATDVVLIFSRHGKGIQRPVKTAWIKPGLDASRWLNRSNYITLGMFQASESELVFYHSVKSLYYKLRLDGFVSLSAGAKEGTFETKTLHRTSGGLEINLSTSAGGSFALEVCDENGKPLPGYTFADFGEFYGDKISYKPTWKGKTFADIPGGKFKLRIKMKECDLYSMNFTAR